MARVSVVTAYEAFQKALTAHGMSPEQAESSAAFFLDAERFGKSSHGAFHLLDYLKALDEKRINPTPRPQIQARGSVIRVDADQGLSQFAFHQALDSVLDTARAQGVAICAISNTYTTGELGWYPRELSRHGMISLTTTNSPALIALGKDGRRSVGTNPIAFGVPGALNIDQAMSNTAYVSVRQRASRGQDLPDGWAVDKDGQPTTSSDAAVEGALLPFGGQRGGNIALITEMLAILAGGVPSITASKAPHGSPSVGLFSVVLNPEAFGEGVLETLSAHLGVLSGEYEVYIPGRDRMRAELPDEVDIDDAVWENVLRQGR